MSEQERVPSLLLAQQEVRRLRIRELFAEYGLSVILHWNKELQTYEIRARNKPGGFLEIHLTKLTRFTMLPIEEQRTWLQRVRCKMHD